MRKEFCMNEEKIIGNALNSLLASNDSRVQARGLAQMAISNAKEYPLRSYEILKTAYSLAPQDEEVLSAIEKLFDLRGNRSGQIKFSSLISLHSTQQQTRIQKIPNEFLVENDKQDETKVVVKNDKSQEGSANLRLDLQPYGVFKDFVRRTKLNIRFLEFAVEFSDDWVGLVQFVNYLIAASHIKKVNLKNVVEQLHQDLKENCPNIKAHVRFTELLDIYLSDKAEQK